MPDPGDRSGADAAETHVSWVLFAGDRAYKILKPVRTGFLDYSTVEHRRVACEREVELNRRLAPDVYLGVSPVLERGRVAEHMVVMVRLPAGRRLSALAGSVDFADRVREVARTVAAFHAGLPPVADAAWLGSGDRLRDLWLAGNLDTMAGPGAPMLGELPVHDPVAVARAAELATGWLAGREALLEQRVQHGWIRDGHGDLLAEDIFCLDDGPRILDCLAFDDDLRRSDVLADLAFLVMDLEHVTAAATAGEVLVDEWEELIGTGPHPRSLLHLYVAERAVVRAKVRGLRAAQLAGQDARASAAAAAEASGFLEMALEHLRAATVRLVLVGGPPGSGKTTLARALAEVLGATVVSTDEVRGESPGNGTPERAAGLDRGRYAPEATARVYDAVLERARVLLGLGESVVLDASWTAAGHRAVARALAAGTSSALVELRCEADPDVAASRVRARIERERAHPGSSGASEATPEVARALAARAEPWPEAHPVPTGGTPAQALAAALAAPGLDLPRGWSSVGPAPFTP